MELAVTLPLYRGSFHAGLAINLIVLQKYYWRRLHLVNYSGCYSHKLQHEQGNCIYNSKFNALEDDVLKYLLNKNSQATSMEHR